MDSSGTREANKEKETQSDRKVLVYELMKQGNWRESERARGADGVVSEHMQHDL